MTAARVPRVDHDPRAAKRGAKFCADSHSSSRKGKTIASQHADVRQVQSSPGEKPSPGRCSWRETISRAMNPELARDLKLLHDQISDAALEQGRRCGVAESFQLTRNSEPKLKSQSFLIGIELE